MQHVRLTHPELDPDGGTGTEPREVLEEASISLGPKLARQLSGGAGLDEARRPDEG